MKKVFALVLALAMIFALAVPAMAAETYTIKIQNANQMTVHTYEAYQIFSGELSTNAAGKEVLSNVEWGTGVVWEDAEGNDILLPKIQAAHAVFAEAKNAAEIADILGKNSQIEAIVNAFRLTVSENLAATPYQTITNSAVTETTYTFSNLEAGYYLIKDKKDSLDNKPDTYTNMILEIVGNNTIIAKDGGVTGGKNINDGGTLKTSADYSIGDTVNFEITGTLPSNYGHFDKFGYKIVDTMSNALTYIAGSMNVYAENANQRALLTEDVSYTLNVTETADGGTSIVIFFEDLKTITEATIDQHTSFFVTYDAILDADADAGEFNPNKVHIEFNNNPHTEDWGKTIEDEVWVVTWELDVTKIDGTNGNKLTGAEFLFYREIDGVKDYVQVSEGKVTGFTKNVAEATTLVSDENGLFVIEGLEADLYYLQETKAPQGYNLREEPITVDITASGGIGTNGKPVVNSLTIKVGLGQPQPGDIPNGTVAMDYINNPGATLPETGGVGTTLFYIFGGLMFVGAAVLLVTKKRMAY